MFEVFVGCEVDCLMWIFSLRCLGLELDIARDIPPTGYLGVSEDRGQKSLTSTDFLLAGRTMIVYRAGGFWGVPLADV